MKDYGVILFHTNSAAIKAEKTLKEAGLDVKLIPTPRELSSDCGVALKFDSQKIDIVKDIIRISKIEISEITII